MKIPKCAEPIVGIAVASILFLAGIALLTIIGGVISTIF